MDNLKRLKFVNDKIRKNLLRQGELRDELKRIQDEMHELMNEKMELIYQLQKEKGDKGE